MRLVFPIAAAAMLAGCAGTSPVTPASVANDVTLISTSFARALPQITALHGVNTAAVDAAIADLQVVAGAVASADQPTTKTLVTRVEADVNAVVAALAAVPALPPPLPTILQAATVILPVVEAEAGILVPAGGASGGMTPAQARAVLGGAA